MSLVTEVETGSPIVTEAEVLTLILVNTLGGSQSPLACRAAGNRNRTKVRTCQARTENVTTNNIISSRLFIMHEIDRDRSVVIR